MPGGLRAGQSAITLPRLFSTDSTRVIWSNSSPEHSSSSLSSSSTRCCTSSSAAPILSSFPRNSYLARRGWTNRATAPIEEEYWDHSNSGQKGVELLNNRKTVKGIQRQRSIQMLPGNSSSLSRSVAATSSRQLHLSISLSKPDQFISARDQPHHPPSTLQDRQQRPNPFSQRNIARRWLRSSP